MSWNLQWAASLALILVAIPCWAQEPASPELPGSPAVNAPAAGALPEGTEQAPASLTSEQQSAASKALCSALAGHYKNAASAGVSALTDPKVLLSAATNYSSIMHVSVSSATTLLKGYALEHAHDILTSCAVGNATRGVTSTLPNAGGVNSRVPGIGNMPGVPHTE